MPGTYRHPFHPVHPFPPLHPFVHRLRSAPGKHSSNATISLVLSCTDCPEGSSTENKGRQDHCTKCRTGAYAQGNGNANCTITKPGQYTGVMEGALTYFECDAGTYANASASYNCSTCPAGWYSGCGENYCRPCAPGSFSSDTRQGSCSRCVRARVRQPKSFQSPFWAPSSYHHHPISTEGASLVGISRSRV